MVDVFPVDIFFSLLFSSFRLSDSSTNGDDNAEGDTPNPPTGEHLFRHRVQMWDGQAGSGPTIGVSRIGDKQVC